MRVDCLFLLTLIQNSERKNAALVVAIVARLLFFNATGTIVGSVLSMMHVLGHSCNCIYGT